MSKKLQPRLEIAQGRYTAVPKDQLAKFKQVVTEKVIRPLEKRASVQRDTVAKARFRYFR